MARFKLKLFSFSTLLLLIFTFTLTTFLKENVSASNTTFNIAAGPDVLASGDGCRLSEAIANINTSAQTHSDCPAGVSASGDVNVISLPADVITLTTNLPEIIKPTNIIGQGNQLSVVDGANLEVAFVVELEDNVQNPVLEYKDFSLRNIENQRQTASSCLSVVVGSPTGSINISNVNALDCSYASFIIGSSMDNDGGVSVSVDGSSISRTTPPSLSPASQGLVLFRSSMLSVSNSTIQGNMVGVAIHPTPNNVHQSLVMSNTTLSGNLAGLLAGVSSDDGAEPTDLSMELTNNTIYSNYNPEQTGSTPPEQRGVGITLQASRINSSVALNLQNNIIASNARVPNSSDPQINCYITGPGQMTITSLGYNLSDNGCIDSFGSSDILSENIDSTISALANNGGTVKTLALLRGSPAIDTGATVESIATDARGFARPFGVAYDIGAYEYGATDASNPLTNTPTPRAPRTGRLAVAALITGGIISSVLLLARVYQKKYHSRSASVK